MSPSVSVTQSAPASVSLIALSVSASPGTARMSRLSHLNSRTISLAVSTIQQARLSQLQHQSRLVSLSVTFNRSRPRSSASQLTITQHSIHSIFSVSVISAAKLSHCQPASQSHCYSASRSHCQSQQQSHCLNGSEAIEGLAQQQQSHLVVSPNNRGALSVISTT